MHGNRFFSGWKWRGISNLCLAKLSNFHYNSKYFQVEHFEKLDRTDSQTQIKSFANLENLEIDTVS